MAFHTFVIDVCVVGVDLDSFGGEVPENAINCVDHLEVLLYLATKPSQAAGALKLTSVCRELSTSTAP